MKNRTITCGECGTEFSIAEAMVDHLVKTGHGMPKEMHIDLIENKDSREKMTVAFIALQTCDNPEEIGAVRCRDEDEE